MDRESELVNTIIHSILEKKGKEIVNINLSNIQNSIFDNFIICHGDSNTQVSSIADAVEKKVREILNKNAGHVEGIENAQWILLDFQSTVVHIFQKEYRDYYQLEELWGDAEITRIEESYNI